MFVVLVYAVLKRFPALGAAAGALIVCGLLVLVLAWLYVKMKHLSSNRGAIFSIKLERYALRRIVEIGTEIAAALQAFRHFIK
jgi:Na+-driven multidrug efflux pump